MPPRKKPFSGKAKKEQLKSHRAHKSVSETGPAAAAAAKRAKDHEDPFPRFVSAIQAPSSEASTSVRRGGPPPSSAQDTGASIVQDGGAATSSTLNDYPTISELRRQQEARRSARSALESRFIKLKPEVIDHYKTVISKRPFQRPIPTELGVLSDRELGLEDGNEDLVCPKRPKWKYYMTKKEVEKNESVMFDKWLAETERKLKAAEDKAKDEYQVMGYFERNLDVWRQLWRVTENSNVILVLLDVRCPLLHFPPSLQDYLQSLKPKKEIILILTKTDLVPDLVGKSWKACLENRFHHQVVMVESYKEHSKGERTQGTRQRFDPGASPEVRNDLVDALQKVHRQLLDPPAWVKPEKRATYRPRGVKLEIDWDAARKEPEHVKRARKTETTNAVSDGVGYMEMTKAEAKKARRNQRLDAISRALEKEKLTAKKKVDNESSSDHDDLVQQDPDPETSDEAEVEDERQDQADLANREPDFLSIGLIGQPNVGKSSLLNALLSAKRVRASKTPGKTKSLQTIFWTKELRLIDCPGLVFPCYTGMEGQVLSSIIPVQNVESVIYELARRMPLERILNLSLPPADETDGDERPQWSTDALLSTYAVEKGFLTAKAARPDIYRAGSLVIRSMQASQIPWCFRPDRNPSQLVSQPEEQRIAFEGIWIKDWKRHRASPGVRLNEGDQMLERGEEHDGPDSDRATESEYDDEEASSDEGLLDDDDDGGTFDSDGSSSSSESPVSSRKPAGMTSAFGLLAVDSESDSESTGSE